MYEAVCLKCEEEIKRGRKEPSDLGRYIGESSRTLSERSKEHIEGLQAYDYNNFIVKHWANCQSDLEEAPGIRFRVLKSFQDALSRLATEAILIEDKATMNSKSEFRNNRISRIVVIDPRKRGNSKALKDEEEEEKTLQKKIEGLRQRKGVDENEKEDISNSREGEVKKKIYMIKKEKFGKRKEHDTEGSQKSKRVRLLKPPGKREEDLKDITDAERQKENEVVMNIEKRR